MPKHKLVPKSSVRCNNIWFKEWKRMPKSQNVPLMTYVKKLLIYYPKNREALKQLTLSIFQKPSCKSPPHFIALWNKLCDQVLAKYKRAYFRFLDIEISYRGANINRLPGAIRTMTAHRTNPIIYKSQLHNKKIIKFSKGLHKMDLSGIPLTPIVFLKVLKHTRNMQSLAIDNLPFLTSQYSKALIQRQKSFLKDFTITGSVAEEYTCNMEAFIKQWDWICSLFTSLHKFRFDAETPEDFDINRIPFDAFKRKNINYDIRVTHQIDTLTFSKANAESLLDLDFLGINFKKEWLSLSSKWDKVEAKHLHIQKQAKNLLFLNLSEMRDFVDLTDLFNACKNISSLDLILSELNSTMIDFSALPELHKLTNFFLQLHNFDNAPEYLFNNLKLCIDKHQCLQTFNLGFFAGFINSDYECIHPLFDSMAEIIKDFTLQFSVVVGMYKGIKYLYEGVEKLSNLEYLGIAITEPQMRVSANFEPILDFHLNQLEESLQNKKHLDYLCFASPHIELKKLSLNFSGAENLKKITLGIKANDEDISLIEEMANVLDLSYLEMGLLEHSEEGWYRVLKVLRKMKNLETLRLREIKSLEEGKPDGLLKRLEDYLKEHPKLELFLCGRDSFIQVLMCTKSYYLKEADPTFWMNPSNIYETRPLKLIPF